MSTQTRVRWSLGDVVEVDPVAVGQAPHFAGIPNKVRARFWRYMTHGRALIVLWPAFNGSGDPYPYVVDAALIKPGNSYGLVPEMPRWAR